MDSPLPPSLLPLGWTMGVWVWGAVAVGLSVAARSWWHRRALRGVRRRWYRIAQHEASGRLPSAYRDARRRLGEVTTASPLAVPWTRRRVVAVTYVRPRDGHRITKIARDARLKIDGREVALPSRVAVSAGTGFARLGVDTPPGEWGEFEAHVLFDGDAVEVRREGSRKDPGRARRDAEDRDHDSTPLDRALGRGLGFELVAVQPPRVIVFDRLERVRFVALALLAMCLLDVAIGRMARSHLAQSLADEAPSAALRRPGTRLAVRLATASVVYRGDTAKLLSSRLRDAADPESVAALVDATMVGDGCLPAVHALHKRLRDDEAAWLLTLCEAGREREGLALEIELAQGHVPEASKRLAAMRFSDFVLTAGWGRDASWQRALRIHLMAGNAEAFGRVGRIPSHPPTDVRQGLACIETVLRDDAEARTSPAWPRGPSQQTLERLRLGASDSAACRVLLADLTRDLEVLDAADDSEYAALVRARDDVRRRPQFRCEHGFALRELPSLLLRGRVSSDAGLRATWARINSDGRRPAIWCLNTGARVLSAATTALSGQVETALAELDAIDAELNTAAQSGADPRWIADGVTSVAFARLLVERRAFGTSDVAPGLGDLDAGDAAAAQRDAHEIAAALEMPARFEALGCDDDFPCSGAQATLDEVGWGPRHWWPGEDPVYDLLPMLDASALAARSLGDWDLAQQLRERGARWVRTVTDPRTARLLAALDLVLAHDLEI